MPTTRWRRRAAAAGAALLAAATGASGAVDAGAGPMRAVPLFRRPEEWTGRLLVDEQGMDVLKNAKEPYAIVSMVGPTRTGKSSLLGRAFLRGANENVFRIGSGVMSYTAGVWITTQPLLVDTPDGPLNVYIVDTEGFGSIGDRMSRTYEANLFTIIYIMSNAVIYNTMFPVDAATMDRMNIYCSQLLQALKALEDGGVGLRRRRPKLIWALQSFNEYNLKNSDISAERFFQHVINASDGRTMDTGVAHTHGTTPAVLETLNSGSGSHQLNERLIGRLFHPVQLVTVRRPHAEDTVVANLHKHDSSSLSEAYLQDAEHLRSSTFHEMQPEHYCETDSAARRRSSRCKMKLWDGPAFVDALTNWLAVGHLDLDSNDEANETIAVDKFAVEHDKWFDRECKQILSIVRRYLRSKARNPKTIKSSKGSLQSLSKADFIQTMVARIRGLQKQAMLRAVQRSQFWKFPARVAGLVERQTKLQTMSCTRDLFETKRDIEGTKLTPVQIKKMRPPTVPKDKVAVVHVTRSEKKVKAEQLKTTARIEEMQQLLSLSANPGLKEMGTAREECFVVYD